MRALGSYFPEHVNPMLDLVRTSLHRAITTPAGDRFAAVRVPKDLARRMNALLGEPLCSRDELGRRRAGRARLAELQRSGGSAAVPVARSAPPTQAPVMVYYEADHNVRMLRRVREMLDAKSITYTELDISTDEVTRDYVFREAKCERDALPVIFIAGSAVGGYSELVEWDVSGRLADALAGR